MYDVECINEPVKGICDDMQAINRWKMCCKIKQVDRSMRGKILFSVKY